MKTRGRLARRTLIAEVNVRGIYMGCQGRGDFKSSGKAVYTNVNERLAVWKTLCGRLEAKSRATDLAGQEQCVRFEEMECALRCVDYGYVQLTSSHSLGQR